MASNRARQRFEAGLNIRQHAHPGLGQGDRSLGSREEALTEKRLELPYLLADRARRHMQLVGGPREAQPAGDRLEGTQ